MGYDRKSLRDSILFFYCDSVIHHRFGAIWFTIKKSDCRCVRSVGCDTIRLKNLLPKGEKRCTMTVVHLVCVRFPRREPRHKILMTISHGSTTGTEKTPPRLCVMLFCRTAELLLSEHQHTLFEFLLSCTIDENF